MSIATAVVAEEPTRGRSKPLGVERKEVPPGTKFGKRVVIEEIPTPPGVDRRMLVRCSCGLITSVALKHLKDKGSTCCLSCGAKGSKKSGRKRLDDEDFVPGKVFEKWTIVGPQFRKRYDGGTRIMVPVECECGFRSTVGRSHLANKRSRSCLECSVQGEFRRIGDISGCFIGEIKSGAIRRGMEFTLTREFLWSLFLAQDRTCPFTGLVLAFGNKNVETTASLDRIDNRQGYTPDNVIWTHKKWNMFRGGRTIEETLDFCGLVGGRRRSESWSREWETIRSRTASLMASPATMAMAA